MKVRLNKRVCAGLGIFGVATSGRADFYGDGDSVTFPLAHLLVPAFFEKALRARALQTAAA